MTTYTLDLDQPSPAKAAREATVLVTPLAGSYDAAHLLLRARESAPIYLDRPHITQPHAERLMQMMRVLLTLKRNRPFDLGVYIDDCGTAACACGWAMLDPWFQKNVPPEPVSCYMTHFARQRGVDHVVSFSSLSQWITDSVVLSDALFMAASYPRRCAHSRAAVAERLRLFLNLAGYTGQHTLEF